MANAIVIKHSLTVTKFPAYGQNPLITYDLNVASNQKEFYAFVLFRHIYHFSEGIITLQEYVFFREISGFQLWVSISDNTVGSANHAVNLSDILEYENLTIHMKDLIFCLRTKEISENLWNKLKT